MIQSAHPVYLDFVKEPIFGFFHPPAEGAPGDTAVLLCPPFGWDEICSYRSRREWAEYLARAGYPTLRIDLPGTGDSGGSPEDPGRLEAWSEAVGFAAKWLGAAGNCGRVAAIGIGLGGLVICSAIAEGAPVDEAILWAVPARGRSFVRELSVFARMEDSQFLEPGGTSLSQPPDGGTLAGGFVLSGETTHSLLELDVAALPIFDWRLARVLLLDRDGSGMDTRLRDWFQKARAIVNVAPGEGYGAMMAEPQVAQAPTSIFELVESWLADRPSLSAASLPGDNAREGILVATGARADAPPQFGCERSTMELEIGGVCIRETPLTVEQPFGHLFGVLAEPVQERTEDLCVVLLNAGPVRRIGPNRMWVEIARRWAGWGVPTLRLDLEGIGDAAGDAGRLTKLDEFYTPELVAQTRAALDELEARGLGRHFVLAGLCSGAYWSFQAALQDERVRAAFLLNPRALFWDPSLETIRDLRRGLLRRSSWLKLSRGEVSPMEVGTLVRQAPGALTSMSRRTFARRRARAFGGDELDHALDRLRDQNKRLLFVFSGEEPLHDELQREGRLDRKGRWPNIELDVVPGRHHTLRSTESQQRAHEALDRALKRELR